MVHEAGREVRVVHEVQHGVLAGLRDLLGELLRLEVYIDEIEYLLLPFHLYAEPLPQSGVVPITPNNTAGLDPDLLPLLPLLGRQYYLIRLILHNFRDLSLELYIILFETLDHDGGQLVLTHMRRGEMRIPLALFEFGLDGRVEIVLVAELAAQNVLHVPVVREVLPGLLLELELRVQGRDLSEDLLCSDVQPMSRWVVAAQGFVLLQHHVADLELL